MLGLPVNTALIGSGIDDAERTLCRTAKLGYKKAALFGERGFLSAMQT